MIMCALKGREIGRLSRRMISIVWRWLGGRSMRVLLGYRRDLGPNLEDFPLRDSLYIAPRLFSTRTSPK